MTRPAYRPAAYAAAALAVLGAACGDRTPPAAAPPAVVLVVGDPQHAVAVVAPPPSCYAAAQALALADRMSATSRDAAVVDAVGEHAAEHADACRADVLRAPRY